MHYMCGRLDHQYGHERWCDDMHGLRSRQVLDGIERGVMHRLCCGQGRWCYWHKRGKRLHHMRGWSDHGCKDRHWCSDVYGVCRGAVLDGIECGRMHGVWGGQAGRRDRLSC